MPVLSLANWAVVTLVASPLMVVFPTPDLGMLAPRCVLATSASDPGGNDDDCDPDRPGSCACPLRPEDDDPACDETYLNPDRPDLDARNVTIGEIVIRNGDVFNTDLPEENRWLYRAANKVHLRTRESTIRQLLLFKPGDAYRQQRIDESERILRDTRYLYDATIRPLRVDGDSADVVVETRDVWTLSGGISVGRSGGKNSARFGLKDTNFLGFGKAVAIKHKDEVDRTSLVARYIDPNVGGSRVRLRLENQDNSDGFLRSAGVERPFYSLDSRWAAGASWTTYDQFDSLYSQGEVYEEFRHQHERYDIYGGVSAGLKQERVHRWGFGFVVQRDRFEPADDASDTTAVPEDRKLSYPWVEFSTMQSQFIEVHNLHELARTEDLNLGQQLRLRLGFSPEAFGSDRDRIVFAFDYGRSLSSNPRQLLFASTHTEGRYGPDGGEDIGLGAGLAFYLRDWGDNLLLIAARGEHLHDADAEHQLLIGGDNGLRGYPLRYVSGEYAALLTVEQRFFTNWNPLKLVRIGAAAFIDVGGAWGDGSEPANPYRGQLLRDVGIGLRLGSTRSSDGSLVTMDLAWPLDGDDSISSTQFLVTTKQEF